jgi:hypothetical protein
LIEKKKINEEINEFFVVVVAAKTSKRREKAFFFHNLKCVKKLYFPDQHFNFLQLISHYFTTPPSLCNRLAKKDF